MMIGVQPLVAAWVFALVAGALLVPVLRRLKAGQVVRSDGPRSHAGKAGTPTMGGLVFLLALSAAGLAWGPRTGSLYLLLFSTWSFGMLGWADDFLKVVARRPLGLRGRYKVAGQLALATAIVAVALNLGRGTIVEVPWYGPLDLGPAYWVLGMLVVLAGANAVNLTDGLDGLAAGATACSFLAYGLIAWSLGEEDLVTFCLATVGALVGFLRYNVYPARVFMGDTGALALGAALGTCAILTRTELLLLFIGGLYVVEALSVILQVFWFHTFGRRILRMSPLHHHFELVGWPEPRVVEFFWACSALCAFLGLLVWRGMG
ncbi:MAG: phospho-N-acetylmuramoyl-pentapeptide-transferase [Bacillota bacterium]